MEVIRKHDELSQFGDWHLLSSADGEFKLDEIHRDKIAIIGTGTNSHCVMLIAPDAYPSNSLFDAAKRIKGANFTFDKQFAEKSILNMLYSSATEKDSTVSTQADKRQFDELLNEAIRVGASDILVSQRSANTCECSFDVDTVISRYRDFTEDEVRGMMRHFYQNVADQDTVEDPVFRYDTSAFAAGDGSWGGHRTRIRYQSKPLFPKGTAFALRTLLMSETSGFKSFDDLNLPESQMALLKKAANKDSGGIILAGVTSSGKTTTVKVMLEHLASVRPDIVLRSLESPPEYIMKGVDQHIVKESKDGNLVSMAENVKELMRMNPTYLFLGEIRGQESGLLFHHMLESGHGVISTTHTNDPFAIYGKLASQGVGMDLMTGRTSMNALIYQRRLPKLCDHCKVPLAESNQEDLIKRLYILDTDLSKVYVASEGGCKHCSHRGINGSKVAMNVVRPDSSMGIYARNNNQKAFDDRWVEICKENNYGDAAETDLYHSIKYMLQGDVSPFTIEQRYTEFDQIMLSEGTRTWCKEEGFSVGL